jgi:hypothetical protein
MPMSLACAVNPFTGLLCAALSARELARTALCLVALPNDKGL